MKKFMTVEELAHDDRFKQTPMPLSLFLRDDFTLEQLEGALDSLVSDEASRINLVEAGGVIFEKRVSPTSDEAPHFISTSLHGIFAGEIQAMEAAGRSCWDFTDNETLPWKFQLDMARQSWDESRHVEIYSALLDHVDVEIGDFPENTVLFELGCAEDPAKRVVGVNRCLEGLALDIFEDTIRFGQKADDDTIWRSVDYVSADEVTHVKFGQVWAKALSESDPEHRQRVAEFQRKVNSVASLGGLRGSYDGANFEGFIPIAKELRRMAGFDDVEMAEVTTSASK